MARRSKKPQDYDEDPVWYCARCYSLNVQYEEDIDSDCCKECGCTDILSTSIENWEELYKRRYGHKFTEKSTKEIKSPIYNMSYKELRNLVISSSQWRNIIYSMYPKFPGGYSREESILLFFDKVSKDNRINDLKNILAKL